MSLWIPCRFSSRSRSVLAKPLEHQCSEATTSPACGHELGAELSAPGAELEALAMPCRALDQER